MRDVPDGCEQIETTRFPATAIQESDPDRDCLASGDQAIAAERRQLHPDGQPSLASTSVCVAEQPVMQLVTGASDEPPELHNSQEVEMSNSDADNDNVTQEEMVMLIQEARKQQSLIWGLLEKRFKRGTNDKQ